jgi:hypothetical protein
MAHFALKCNTTNYAYLEACKGMYDMLYAFYAFCALPLMSKVICKHHVEYSASSSKNIHVMQCALRHGRHIWFYYTSKQSEPSQMTLHDTRLQ